MVVYKVDTMPEQSVQRCNVGVGKGYKDDDDIFFTGP